MLVLTRKLNEEITIGNNITVKVLQVKGNSVRLGIEAPRDVRIVRGELPSLEDKSSSKQEKSAGEAESQMTVVFSNPRDQKGTRLDVFPVDNADHETTGSRFEPVTTSVHFQKQLPESLKRSRLQEIVNEITSK